MKIEVDQKSIDYGLKGSPCWCPLAHAIRRHIDNFKTDVTIRDYRTARIRFYGENSYVNIWVTLPFKARRFAKRFDKGRPVKPLSFNLELDAKQIKPQWTLERETSPVLRVRKKPTLVRENKK